MPDDDREDIEEVAREFVQRNGDEAPDVLRERAEMAEAIGDRSSAETWREIAEAAERRLRVRL